MPIEDAITHAGIGFQHALGTISSWNKQMVRLSVIFLWNYHVPIIFINFVYALFRPRGSADFQRRATLTFTKFFFTSSGINVFNKSYTITSLIYFTKL